jgi:dolichyl-phosphate beta-glucosyltransferase
MFLSVILPVYNEAKAIKNNLERIINYLQTKDFSWEIICVDDGSKDESPAILKEFPLITLIINGKNLGKGGAVRRGVLAAHGQWRLFLDADLSTDITELDKFLPFLNQYQILIGTRQAIETQIVKKQPIYRVFLGRLGNLLIRTFLGYHYKDTLCGFKIFNSDCLDIFAKQTIYGWGFDFELLYLASQKKYKTKEVGVTWQDSAHSNIKLKSYWLTLKELIKIKLNIIKKKYE